MPSALLVSSRGQDAPPLAEHLAAAGVHVIEGGDSCSLLLHSVITNSPDFVVLYDASPEPALFESTTAIMGTAPLPVLVFTMDPDAEKIALATRSGVHAYVVNGYGQNRLRSLIHLAQARFREEQVLREELSQVNQRFAERKLVDRAKGILMGARQLREEEAYRALRRAAMHTKQRIGQVSRQVIDSARYGEAINRAGQLRMLSQRLVKLYALRCAGIEADQIAGLYADSIGHSEANLALLARLLSKPTFGDLLDAVLTPWRALRSALEAPASLARLREVDGLAEQVLLRGEQLVANLEIAGLAGALHVINVAGRHRMLSQRITKAALMAVLLAGADAKAACLVIASTKAELDDGLVYLSNLPLTNAEISHELDQARQHWEAFQVALAHSGTITGQTSLAALSEVLLGHFDRLTDHFERGMHALMN